MRASLVECKVCHEVKNIASAGMCWKCYGRMLRARAIAEGRVVRKKAPDQPDKERGWRTLTLAEAREEQRAERDGASPG